MSEEEVIVQTQHVLEIISQNLEVVLNQAESLADTHPQDVIVSRLREVLDLCAEEREKLNV